MKYINLQNGHIKIYKRENSQYWQMRIKPPKKKALRESTGCKSLREAKDIAINRYKMLTFEKKIVSINATNQHQYKGKHLLGIKNLSKNEIEYILDYAQQFIEFNNQKIKKDNILIGRSVFNVFF